MGGYFSSNPEEKPSPPETLPKATRIRNFDRTFILFGKVNCGKSTLGNLLMGNRDHAYFETHPFLQPSGLTKVVKSGETEIEASIVYGEECQSSDFLKIQILDQPGSNDGDFNSENYGDFLMKCIAEARSEMVATFLILIDLTSRYFSMMEILTFLNISQILSNSCYSFFPNAIIIFTHEDLLVENSDESPEQILRQKLEQEAYASIQELVNLVDQRYIFVNGVNKSEINRNNILKKLFQLTRPNLDVYVNGNNGFEGKELKKLFGADSNTTSFKKNSLKYDIEYHFNPDLNLFRKYDTLNLEANIGNILDKLSGISKGISVMVLLISLEETYNEEIHSLLLNLPNTYNLGEGARKDFWDYSCIVFKSAVDKEDVVFSSVQGNRLLREMVWKVKYRYTWVTKNTSPLVSSERVLELARKVKFDSKGKVYTDSVVLAEINKIIQESVELKNSETRDHITLGIKNLDLVRVGLPFFKTKEKRSVSINDFFWSRKSISTQVGYFILKNINPEIADRFKGEYSTETIDTEQYLNFCGKNLK